jgi:hypothetical protein
MTWVRVKILALQHSFKDLTSAEQTSSRDRIEPGNQAYWCAVLRSSISHSRSRERPAGKVMRVLSAQVLNQSIRRRNSKGCEAGHVKSRRRNRSSRRLLSSASFLTAWTGEVSISLGELFATNRGAASCGLGLCTSASLYAIRYKSTDTTPLTG